MYKDVKVLISKYEGLLRLCEMAGVNSDGIRFKLDACYFLLGRK